MDAIVYDEFIHSACQGTETPREEFAEGFRDERHLGRTLGIPE